MPRYSYIACLVAFDLQHTTQTSMPLAGFEPIIEGSERPWTLRLRPRGHWDRQGFDPRTFQHVASRYTDWASPDDSLRPVSV